MFGEKALLEGNVVLDGTVTAETHEPIVAVLTRASYMDILAHGFKGDLGRKLDVLKQSKLVQQVTRRIGSTPGGRFCRFMVSYGKGLVLCLPSGLASHGLEADSLRVRGRASGGKHGALQATSETKGLRMHGMHTGTCMDRKWRSHGSGNRQELIFLLEGEVKVLWTTSINAGQAPPRRASAPAAQHDRQVRATQWDLTDEAPVF